MFGISVSCGGCWVAQSCLTLCDPMDSSTPALFVLHHLSKFAQVHVHCIGDAIQSSHPLTPPSSSALYLSQHQGLFQWVSCLHQMIRILELQLQHRSFQWVLRVDFPCLTGLISLLSKGLLGVFPSTTVQRHQFFSTPPSLWSNSHNYTWPLGRSQLLLYRPVSVEECFCFSTRCFSLCLVLVWVY